MKPTSGSLRPLLIFLNDRAKTVSGAAASVGTAACAGTATSVGTAASAGRSTSAQACLATAADKPRPAGKPSAQQAQPVAARSKAADKARK